MSDTPRGPKPNGCGIAVLVGLAGLLFVFAGPFEIIVKYWNFTTLTKAHVVQRAQAYVGSRVRGPVTHICIYEVDCSGDEATLKLVDNIDTWDFEAAKARIWRRRFSDACSGRTANFGLHILTNGEELDSRTHARWVFLGNGFAPKSTRFGGGSFSEEPWERCTPERATIQVR